MRINFLHLAASSLLAVGCMASGRVHTSASVSAPELVYIGPDVQVIADYHEPVFYSSSFYWRYNGGVWYRSSNHTSGWVRYSAVPQAILRIETPTAYIRYRGSANAAATSGPSPQQRNEERREQKQEQKEERREERQEQKEERREEKEERKEERKEAKEDRKDAKEDHKNSKGDHGKKGR